MTTIAPASGDGSAEDKAPAAPPPEKLVTLTIDGVELSVPKGTLVIRAAEQIGIQIPRFCDHPLLDPIGACRQCLVEVPDAGNGRGMPKPQPSCTLAVAEGMQVRTQLTSPVADKAQHGQMEFLLINHPLDCPVCDKGGECPLQNQAMSNGRPKTRFLDIKRTYPKPINISTQILLDRDRCILCTRCTRFSEEIPGDPFLTMNERGALQQVGIYEERPFDSYFSGNTVQICPVGALTGSAYRFRSRPFDLVSTPSICEHCASGCAQRTDHRRGVVLRRMALEDPAVNEEWNCDKGRWAFRYATSKRVEFPLVRDAHGELQVAGWPEALEAAARGLRDAREGRGVGVLTGGRISIEDAYAYAKFARLVLGTNDIDFRARPHSAEESAFLAYAVAGTGPHSDRAAVTYADLEAARSVLLVGFEPEDESPMIFLRLRKAWRKRGLNVMAIAPFVTPSLRKMGGSLIAAAPGTEAEVLEALRSGSNELAGSAEALGEDSIVLVGERMATVPGALSAAAALAAAKGARLAWIPRRAGERGALEAGAAPGLLPGARPVTDAAARDEVAAVWGAGLLPDSTGRDTAGILTAAAAGELSGLVVGGVDLDDLPDRETAVRGLDRAFVVSLEMRDATTQAYADVVLPVAPQQEKSGSFLDWEGRVRIFHRAIESQHLSDFRALDLLAAELGEFLGTRTVEQIRAELDEIGTWSGERPVRPRVRSTGVPRPLIGEAVLATWSQLLDSGVLQDGEPYLAGTARPVIARLSQGTAEQVGVRDGEPLTVSTRAGSITVPAAVTPMPDHVVWLPTNSGESRVRGTLRADAGDIVALRKGADMSKGDER